MCNEKLYLVFEFIKRNFNNKKLTRAHSVCEHSNNRCSEQQASLRAREQARAELYRWRLHQQDKFPDSLSR